MVSALPIVAHRSHILLSMKTTNEKMNAVAASVASDLGCTPAEAAALLVHVLRNERPALLAAVRAEADTDEDEGRDLCRFSF